MKLGHMLQLGQAFKPTPLKRLVASHSHLESLTKRTDLRFTGQFAERREIPWPEVSDDIIQALQAIAIFLSFSDQAARDSIAQELSTHPDNGVRMGIAHNLEKVSPKLRWKLIQQLISDPSPDVYSGCQNAFKSFFKVADPQAKKQIAMLKA